jgi:hypothetical protein
VVIFTPWPLYLCENKPPLHTVRRLGGPQSQSGHFEEGKSLLLQLRIESHCVGDLVSRLITVETELLCITGLEKKCLLISGLMETASYFERFVTIVFFIH